VHYLLLYFRSIGFWRLTDIIFLFFFSLLFFWATAHRLIVNEIRRFGSRLCFRRPVSTGTCCPLCDTTKSLHTKLSNYIKTQRRHKLIISRASILGIISPYIPINSTTTCSFLLTTNPTASAAFLNRNFDTHFVTPPRSKTIHCWLPKDFWSVLSQLAELAHWI
jgi:hypothetical protein